MSGLVPLLHRGGNGIEGFRGESGERITSTFEPYLLFDDRTIKYL